MYLPISVWRITKLRYDYWRESEKYVPSRKKVINLWMSHLPVVIYKFMDVPSPHVLLQEA